MGYASEPRLRQSNILVNVFLASTVLLFLISAFQIFIVEGLSLSEISNQPAIPWLLFSLFVSICMTGLAISLYKSWHFAFFWIFNLIFFGLAPISFFISEERFFTSRASILSELEKGAVIASFTTLFTALINLFIMRRKSHDEPKLLETDHSFFLIREKRLLLLKVIFLISLFPLISYIGIEFFQRRVIYQAREITPLKSIAINSLLAIPMLVTCSIILRARTQKKSFLTAEFFSWLLLCTIIANPITQPRQNVLFVFIPILFCIFSSNRNAFYLFIGTLFYFLIYGASVIDRYSGDFTGFKSKPFSIDGDFDAFIQLSRGVAATNFEIFPLLRQFFGSLVFFIPRDFYSNKPFDTGTVVANASGISFGNLSAPWILEGFVNLRYLGIAIFAFLIMTLIKKCSSYTFFNHGMFLMSAVYLGSLFILLRGSLLQATGRIVFTIFLIYWLTKPRRQAKNF